MTSTHIFATLVKYTTFILYLTIGASIGADCCAIKKSVNTKDTEKLKIELLADVPSVNANSTFQLGLHIRHFKELSTENGSNLQYHTYWKNPGIVGVPTNIKWQLPEGFTISDAQWPYPELTKMIDIPCYGYERDIIIMYTVTAPKNLTQKNITISGGASWMCCATKCHPGYSTLSLTLPVTEKVEARAHPVLFDQAYRELPKSEHSIKATLLSSPNAPQIKVHLRSSKPFIPIHLFNSDGQTSPDQTHSLEHQPDNSWIYLAQRPEHSPKDKKEFPMVLQTKSGYFTLSAKPEPNK